MEVKGTIGVKLFECINPIKNKWAIRWNVLEDSDGGAKYEEVIFDHKPELSEVKELIYSWENEKIKKTIVSGFKWKKHTVWLSPENQQNYQANFTLAKSDSIAFPIICKFGTDEKLKYYEFQTLEEYSSFYLSYNEFIKRTQQEGWNEKDNFDFTVYDIK